MSHDSLDRILASEEEIRPSSGFVASVMDSVRHEATAPPPLPFPWKRALPGILAGVLALAVLCVSAASLFTGQVAAPPGPSVLAPAFLHALHSVAWGNAAWAGLVLILSLVVVELSANFVEPGTW